MTEKKPKRPRDPNQLAKMVIDIATGEVADEKPSVDRRGAAGGKVGGAARAKTLTPERKREIAQNAAKSRWKASARSD